jgi:hypothetical protein
MTSAKILSLRKGQPAPQPGVPIEAIVADLEKALAEAKSGNMRAFALVYVIAPDSSMPGLRNTFYAELGRARDLWMEIGRMTRLFAKWLDE